jgi:hypothetical protein
MGEGSGGEEGAGQNLILIRFPYGFRLPYWTPVRFAKVARVVLVFLPKVTLHSLWIISQHRFWRYEFQMTTLALRQQWPSISPFQNLDFNVVCHWAGCTELGCLLVLFLGIGTSLTIRNWHLHLSHVFRDMRIVSNSAAVPIPVSCLQ